MEVPPPIGWYRLLAFPESGCFALLDRFEIGVRGVDHFLARGVVSVGYVREQARPRRDQVLHAVGPPVAGEDVLDFHDLSVFPFQAERDDERFVEFLHDSIESDWAAGEIDGVILKVVGASEALTHKPSPTGISAVFSVKRTPLASGSPDGSCFTSAAR